MGPDVIREGAAGERAFAEALTGWPSRGTQDGGRAAQLQGGD
jgi:hypothetical protein